jgi:hypothetical protein
MRPPLCVLTALLAVHNAQGFSNVPLFPSGNNARHLGRVSEAATRGNVGPKICDFTPGKRNMAAQTALFAASDWARMDRMKFEGDLAIYTEEVDGNDVGVIQAANPLTPQNPYFEVTMVDGGTNSWLGVGIADKDYPLDKQPGWDTSSAGYHADDGCIYKSPRVEDKSLRYKRTLVQECPSCSSKRLVWNRSHI